jgi:hypothetical protein
MGWWNSGSDGSSLHSEDTGLTWGDGPADVMDSAIERIVKEFESAWGRKPLRAELEAGFLFSLNVYSDIGVEREQTTPSIPGMLNVGPMDAEEAEVAAALTDRDEKTLRLVEDDEE